MNEEKRKQKTARETHEKNMKVRESKSEETEQRNVEPAT